MKFSVGQKVRIKSLDWYNKNTNECGYIIYGCVPFNTNMSIYCGKVLTIDDANEEFSYYKMKECKYVFTDEMIEGLVEEETKPNIIEEAKTYWDSIKDAWICPEGYVFKDENGNVINATKIVLEKVNTLKTQSDNMETETHRGYYTTEEETTNESKKVAWFTFGDNDFADKVELDLSNRELIQEDGKWFVVKKKKEYPKTYEECCKVMNYCCNPVATETTHKEELIRRFQFLLLYRDAYWKIAGEEMGLGKPWAPDWDNISDKYCIYFVSGQAWSKECQTRQCPFAFPTPEMRDAFYENFKELIESCKELL